MAGTMAALVRPEMGTKMAARRLDVLLVDDDEQVRGPVAELLSVRHEVRVASGLRDAVDQLVKRVPDAIICDFDLPPYRGDVFLALVAREHPEVRRVLYTGSLPSAVDCMTGVAHAVLTKPSTLAQLLAAIDDYNEDDTLDD
jgi:DNA-binding NtrC family response regulator